MSGPRLAGLGVVAVLLLGMTACSADTPTTSPAAAVPVKLTADVAGKLSIGVVVSQTSAPGEGSEWRDAAEGARVAAARFVSGGTQVGLVPVNDKGTVDGAAAAVKTLADQGVSGIVLATSGDHVRGALREAAARRIPIVMPYADSDRNLPSDAWLTGPTAAMTDQRLVKALADRGLTRPFLIDAGGGSVSGLTPVGVRKFAAGNDPVELARSLAARLSRSATAFDAVVISGPAQLQGSLVAALQGAGVHVADLLTPDALSPSFPRAILAAGGTLSGTFLSSGLDEGDARALEPTESGRALAAYLSALSMAAGNGAVPDLFAERPFRAVAGAADVRSHDAVVALVRAAAAAKSADPGATGEALAGLRLGVPDGIAGAPLDFGAQVAVADDAVQALAATPVSPGVRPAYTGAGATPAPSSGGATADENTAALFWFAAPAS